MLNGNILYMIGLCQQELVTRIDTGELCEDNMFYGNVFPIIGINECICLFKYCLYFSLYFVDVCI